MFHKFPVVEQQQESLRRNRLTPLLTVGSGAGDDSGQRVVGRSRPTRRLNQPHRAQDCQVIAVPPDQVWRRAPVELINAQPGYHGVGAAARDADQNAGLGSGVGEQAGQCVAVRFVSRHPHRQRFGRRSGGGWRRCGRWSVGEGSGVASVVGATVGAGAGVGGTAPD